MKIVGLEEHVALPQLLAAWFRIPGAPQIPELGYGDAPLAPHFTVMVAEPHDRNGLCDTFSPIAEVLARTVPDTVAMLQARSAPSRAVRTPAATPTRHPATPRCSSSSTTPRPCSSTRTPHTCVRRVWQYGHTMTVECWSMGRR